VAFRIGLTKLAAFCPHFSTPGGFGPRSGRRRHSAFHIPHSTFIHHSSFIIRHS
jgi:hypothetical protein